MKLSLFILFSFFMSSLLAQSKDSAETSKVFVSSGMGFGFPVGRTHTSLSPKFSNSLGLNIPTKGNVFYYPVVDFLKFGYDQGHGPSDAYRIQKGTGNLYSFSFMPGYTTFIGSLKAYGFAGPSLHWVHEPRSRIDIATAEVHIEKIKYFTFGTRAGVGAHYQMGNFYLFLETAWMHNFHLIQEAPVNIISLHGGLKTDVTDLTHQIGDLLKGRSTAQ